MIPDAAVEAAAKILYAREWFSSWEVEDDSVHDSYGRKVRELLEAAAPHFASEWHDAVSAAYVNGALSADQANAMYNANPYRSAA